MKLLIRRNIYLFLWINNIYYNDMNNIKYIYINNIDIDRIYIMILLINI